MSTSCFFENTSDILQKKEISILIYATDSYEQKKWVYSIQYSNKNESISKFKIENKANSPEQLTLYLIRNILQFILKNREDNEDKEDNEEKEEKENDINNINNNILIYTDNMYLKMILNEWIAKWRKTNFITDSGNKERPNYEMLIDIDKILVNSFSSSNILCKYTTDSENIKTLKL